MTKIAITNIVALNGGDAAILLGMIKALKARFGNGTKIVVFASYPEVCRKLYPDIEWRETIGIEVERTRFCHIRYLGRISRIIKRLWYYGLTNLYGRGLKFIAYLFKTKIRESLKIYASSDYIISTGGTYLIEPYGINTQYSDYKISLYLRRPLIFYTQSMGPFYKRSTQHKLRSIFNRTKHIFFRDQKSKEHVLDLHLKRLPKIQVVPDAAFALGEPALLLRRNGDKIGQKKKVAFSVRNWRSFMNHSANDVMSCYRNSIAEAVRFLIDDGYTVYFISTCQGIKEYHDDNIEVKKIIEIVPKEYRDRVISYNNYLSIAKIRAILEEMDFIVSTRLHMCILSLITGTPVFPIAYEFKTIELFNSLGYDDVMDMESLINNSLIVGISEFVEKYDKSRQQVNDKVINYINESLSVPQFIL